MKYLIARFLRQLFRIPFFKKIFVRVYLKIFLPSKIFEGVTEQIINKDGIRFNLQINDWIQSNLYFLGEYEFDEICFLKNSLSKGDTFFDIGANIGLYTLSAAKKLGNSGKIFAFEPFSVNYKRLVKNISLNGFTNIIAEKLAVSDKNESISVFYDEQENNLGMVSSFLTDFSQKETVKSVTIDHYVEKNCIKDIKFVKIDIEGGEFFALKGMENTLKNHNPILLIEIIDELLNKSNVKSEEVIDYLKGLNYQLFYIGKNGALETTQTKKGRNNFVFIKS